MTRRRLADFEPLSPAGKALVDGLDEGLPDGLAGGALPGLPDGRRAVRAAVLRLLILLGPDAPLLVA